MGGTTTLSALPYPAGTDKVQDGDDAIKALADKLDPLVNQNSVLATINTNATGTVRVFRRGFLCIVNALITVNTAIASGNLLFTLPAGYRAAGPDVYFFGTLTNAVTDANVRTHNETATGIVSTQVALSAGALVRGTLVYPVSSLT